MEQVAADVIPSGLVEVDAANRIVRANALVSQWSGIDRSDLVGRPFDSVVQPPKQLGTVHIEYLPDVAEIIHPNGHLHPVLVVRGAPDAAGRCYVTLFEATAQRKFREQIQAGHDLARRAQTRLELVIDASIAFAEVSSERQLAEILVATTARAYAAEESAVFLLDDDRNFRLVAGTNPLAGLDPAESLTAQAVGLRTVMKISGVDAARSLSPAVAKAFEASGVQAVIVAPIHQGDEPMGILAAFFHHPRQFDEQASPLADALAGQAARAVTAIRLQERLSHAAMHDDNTGLPNRRFLEDSMGSLPAGDHVIGVLFIDLDGFKTVNDQLGHWVGDELLREVAIRLRETVREGDLVARYGGDEFVVVCQVESEDAANQLAERVRHCVAKPYVVLPSESTITASIGVSVASVDSSGVRAEWMLRAADQAMYQAKYAGGDRVFQTTVEA